MPAERKIKVLIVDDAASMRIFLRKTLESAGDIEVIGTAQDPLEAIELLKTHTPDVMTLDVEMPNMDGLTFLEKIMRLKPLPVVMVSTLTARGSQMAIKALELGAVDVVGKPTSAAKDLEPAALQIIQKVREAACARVGRRAAPTGLVQQIAKATAASPNTQRIDTLIPTPIKAPVGRPPLIAIGASTGGTEALRQVLAPLPTNLPPIVIVQHMPAGFTTHFAARLNGHCAIEVSEAVDGEPLKSGHAYIAPGDLHIRIDWQGSNYVARILDTERINRHRPSADVLLRSTASAAGAAAIGIILTGMGDDGARGLLDVRNCGGQTMAQDEATCVVYGMPRVAKDMGAVMNMLPLQTIPQEIIRLSQELKTALPDKKTGIG
ncbi:MAG: chemotaxis-specific protein-glutamate methyltransferase CheB [Proteobacteria bacterium]|nr:chemotaxis-specific protein-glutamate methyltransferase CheB [Pseudomonadota bacterium]